MAAPPPGPRRRISMSDITLPGAAVRATRRPTSLVRDSLTMAARCARMSRRNLDALLTSLILPVMLMVMFVYLFGGAIHTGTRYVTYVVPGVLLLCAGFGASLTAVSVSNDMTGGIIDRFRSMDIGGAAVLFGHVAARVGRHRDGLPAARGPAAMARGRGCAVAVRGRGLVAVRGGRAACLIARGRQRLHVLRDFPALSEQCLRADLHHAVLAARVRGHPASHPGGRDLARAAPGRAGRRQRGAGPGLVRRNPDRLGHAVQRVVPAADRAFDPLSRVS